MAIFTRVPASLIALVLLVAAVVVPVGPAGADTARSAPEANAPTLDIQGCWTGDVSNDSLGNTSITFAFVQRGPRIQKGPKHCPATSSCGSAVFLGDTVAVAVPIGGTVDSTGFSFHDHFRFPLSGCGQAFRKCRPMRCEITGQALLQNDGSFTGSYQYQGKCAELGFVGGDFSISRSCN